MSSTVICYDNAIKETFLKTLLAVLTYHVNFKDRNDACKEILNYFIIGTGYTALLIIVRLRSMNVLK